MKYLNLIVKNLLRNRRRSLLVLLALSISFFLYSSVSTLIASMYQRLNVENADLNLILRPLYMSNFFDPQLPSYYLKKVREIPLVHASTPYKIYLGEGRMPNQHAFVIGADPHQIDKIRRLHLKDRSQLKKFQANRQAVLVGELSLKENNWHVGNSVILKGVRNNPDLPIKIVGVLKNSGDFGSAILAHYDYIQNIFDGNGDMSVIFLRARKPFEVPWLTQAIKDAFAASPVKIDLITEKSFLRSVLSDLEGVVTAIQIIAWVTLLATVLIVGNTLSMAMRERKTEIGVLRTIGFSQWLLFRLFLGEAMLLSLLGGILGAGSAWGIFNFGDIQIATGMGGSKFNIAPQLRPVFEAIALSLVVGFASSVIPAMRYSRAPITENLGSVA